MANEELDEEDKETIEKVIKPLIERKEAIKREMVKRRMENYLHLLGNQIAHYADFVVMRMAKNGVYVDYTLKRDVKENHMVITIDLSIKPESQRLFEEA